MHLTYNFKQWEHFPEKGVSYLQQEDTPERMKDTLALWKQFEANPSVLLGGGE
jgi:hypothetical protein